MFKEEVFEITDFTTSSEWERFISDLEEIIREWGLQSNENELSDCGLTRGLTANAYTFGVWKQKYATIKFAKLKFDVVFHYLDDSHHKSAAIQSTQSINKEENQSIQMPSVWSDMMSRENDFPSRSHCLVRWYGMRSFIIISPSGNKESISTEDRVKLLLSSACIALNNTNCSLPIFFQLHQRQRKYYHGICQNDSMRVYFDMIHLNAVPTAFRYLSQLLTIFKDKLSSSVSEMPPVMVSIRFTHALKQWPDGWLITESSDENNENFGDRDAEDRDASFNKLLWKCSEEPIQELQLATTWPILSEEVVVDSPVHSDLDPFSAPFWSLRVLFKDDIKCSISDTLNLIFSLKNCWAKNDQILGKLIAEIDAHDAEIEIKQALNRLTNPSPLSVSLPQFQTKILWNRPKWIKEQCLNFIFNENLENFSENNSNDIKTIKSAPINSLTWRIALTLCNVYYYYREIADIAHMWKEIICQLRYHWENKLILPHLGTDAPNLGMCLFHQKLQMLNRCIEQKIKRESRNTSENNERDNESDEEFFDCNEEEGDNSAFIKPEGRSAQCADLRLLNADVPLFIPITQDSPPLTEDMLYEHSLILSKLSNSPESASLRARMQCSSLISDMEAFKAANPQSVIEDFIRWHSPRDWIQSDDNIKKGYLSSRMENPSNIWHEVWASAKPVPVSRQKRLFDDTKEAEKVLHYFASLTVNDFIDLILPTIIHCSILQVIEKRNELNISDNELPFDKNAIISYFENSECDKAIDLIGESELKINQFQSLIKKFDIANQLEFDPKSSDTVIKDDIKKFVNKLMSEPEVEFSSYGYFGKLIRRMFAESQIAIYESNTSIGERDANEENLTLTKLPFPIAKEFIFRVSHARPNCYSRSVPNRMYCLLSAGEFRLAGAFSEDTTYF